MTYLKEVALYLIFFELEGTTNSSSLLSKSPSVLDRLKKIMVTVITVMPLDGYLKMATGRNCNEANK